MTDPHLSIILSIMIAPKKNIKFHMDASKVSRRTFFKVKSDLETRGIISMSEAKHLGVDAGKALKFVLETYPGLPAAFNTFFKGTDQGRSAVDGSVEPEDRIS